jgi:hypothetical protein
MKNFLYAVVLASIASLLGCAGSSQEAINVWKNPAKPQDKKYTSVFIIVITKNVAARNLLETDLAAAAQKRGLKATKSIDALPETITSEIPPSKDELLKKIRAMNCDVICTVALLDTKSEQRYVPGQTTYSGAYSPYSHYGYYGQFYGYYAYTTPLVSTPGYYEEKQTLFLEGNIYDAATEEIQFSMQSKSYDPRDLQSFSKEYVHLLLDQLGSK